MLAENVSLGVLALPQALAILGLVPGLLCILFLGLIATYTGWVIGEFKLARPSVQSYADCDFRIAGPIGREVLAVGQVLILVFIMSAHVLSFGIAMNVMTEHGACTIVFSVVGLVVCFLLGLPRTFKNISYFSVFCKYHSDGTLMRANRFSLCVDSCSCFCSFGRYRHRKTRHGQHSRRPFQRAARQSSGTGHEHNPRIR